MNEFVLKLRTKCSETDLDEVLQTHNVFINVSKGVVAKKDDLLKCFPDKKDVNEIILEILEKGELQVSEKERGQQTDKVFRDISTIIAEKCVDPETKRPFTVTLIERALKDIHFSVNTKSAKQQALEAIKQLKESSFPITRAQMKIAIYIPAKEAKRIQEKLKKMVAKVDAEENEEDQYIMDCHIDPGSFRTITEYVKNETKSKGNVEVLTLSVQEEGESKME
eukprot:TRINITY_DN1183_c0_g1_i1.p1 TRINITY_DN1183_c0_g1~~TRINITY_DN1183_c0_g1_i1.p1  ORF type:complete len:223 (+),score=87.91 TRINITY_DN1183_c0_g1_i1:43-711(+)